MSKCYELKRYDIETDHGDTYEGVVASYAESAGG